MCALYYQHFLQSSYERGFSVKVRDDPIPVMEHSLVEKKLHIIQFAKFYHRETVGVLNTKNLYIFEL